MYDKARRGDTQAILDYMSGNHMVEGEKAREPLIFSESFDGDNRAQTSKSNTFSEDDKALIDLAKEGKKKGGLSKEEAEALVEMGKESTDSRINGDKSRGPEKHKNKKNKDDHIHVGPINHIPVK